MHRFRVQFLSAHLASGRRQCNRANDQLAQGRMIESERRVQLRMNEGESEKNKRGEAQEESGDRANTALPKWRPIRGGRLMRHSKFVQRSVTIGQF